MDPATIAAGKYAQEKARLLWQKIRAKLDGDAPTKVVLDKFEKAPETSKRLADGVRRAAAAARHAPGGSRG